jgi:hypothetical protein
MSLKSIILEFSMQRSTAACEQHLIALQDIKLQRLPALLIILRALTPNLVLLSCC